MPEGPFGLPRLTSLGPLVDKDAEEYYEREIDEFRYIDDEDEAIAELTGADLGRAKLGRAEHGVDMEDRPKDSGILAQIDRGIKAVTSKMEVASISYWFDTGSGVAKIESAHTSEEFRKEGIATELKEKEMEFLKQEGIDVVFTDVVSEGGYRLARNTGFVPITETDMDSDRLVFFDDRNRGFMVRFL